MLARPDCLDSYLTLVFRSFFSINNYVIFLVHYKVSWGLSQKKIIMVSRELYSRYRLLVVLIGMIYAALYK